MGKLSRFGHTYRIIPIIIASLLLFAVICCLAVLIWAIIVYLGKNEVGDGQALPAVIWLISLLLSSALMTLATKGGTVFPALFLGVIAVILSCLMAGEGLLTVGGVLLKVLLSLLAAVVGFTLAKLYLMIGGKLRAPRKKMPVGRSRAAEIFDDMDLSQDDEYSGFKEYHR